VLHMVHFGVLHALVTFGVVVCGRGRHDYSLNTPRGYSNNSANCPVM
jgi:hypothetical protein